MGSDNDANDLNLVPRDIGRLDALDLYATWKGEDGHLLYASEAIDGIVSQFRRSIEDLASQDSTMHGWRTQAMFESLAVSLDEIQFLKTEDAGETYVRGLQARAPDFRITTAEGERILVEVKNFKSNGVKPFKIRKKDLEKLSNYAELLDETLFLAIYWVGWNLWTLIKPDRLIASKQHHTISLSDAMKCNEMVQLGDFFVGTRWPIDIDIAVRPGSDQTVVDGDGLVATNFTIDNITVSVAGSPMSTNRSSNIMFNIVLYSDLEESVHPTIEADGRLSSVKFRYEPTVDEAKQQDVHFHAPASSFHARMFLNATTDPHGEVTTIRHEPFRNWFINNVKSAADDGLSDPPLWLLRMEAS